LCIHRTPKWAAVSPSRHAPNVFNTFRNNVFGSSTPESPSSQHLEDKPVDTTILATYSAVLFSQLNPVQIHGPHPLIWLGTGLLIAQPSAQRLGSFVERSWSVWSSTHADGLVRNEMFLGCPRRCCWNLFRSGSAG
jgi:hypothetical protein